MALKLFLRKEWNEIGEEKKYEELHSEGDGAKTENDTKHGDHCEDLHNESDRAIIHFNELQQR